jgi:hypothetical protein
MVLAAPLRRPVHGRRGLGRAGLLGRSRIGAAGRWDAMITDIALTIVAIVAFVIMAELAWRSFQ